MVSNSLHDSSANQQTRTFTKEERRATGKGWCAGGKGGTGFKPKKKSQLVTQDEYNEIQGMVEQQRPEMIDYEKHRGRGSLQKELTSASSESPRRQELMKILMLLRSERKEIEHGMSSSLRSVAVAVGEQILVKRRHEMITNELA
eukprot:gene1013-565_t